MTERRLRLLVLAVADRCDQQCLHCQIWQGPAVGAALSLNERLGIADAALAAGVEQVLLTGGEPLLSSDLWPLAERLHGGGARLVLATNGMLLEQHAAAVARWFHEVYVSLDGGRAELHDRLRGVAAWDRLSRGVARLRAHGGVKLVARCALHAGNLDAFSELIEAARRLGFDQVSFLPLDASSAAFGGRPDRRTTLVPSPFQIRRFEAEVERLPEDGFVVESRAKLQGLARHLRASAGQAEFARPDCDAPWWSVVVEADGSVRPCFFHQPVGDARDGLGAVLASAEHRAALERIAAPNDTCARCVCPKLRQPHSRWQRLFG